MKEFYQNSTESLNKLTEMSRKVFSLLAILVVLLYISATNAKDSKEKKPKPCKENEYWSSCRALCESTCGFPDGSRCLKKKAGCICQKGLVRGSNGNCIDPSDCGNERTGPVLFGNESSN